MPDYLAQRSNMAASQVHAGGVTDERLLAAFREIPREEFVPSAKRETAYADAPIEIVHGRWLLAPATFARLLQLANISPADRVLDVGCLTGYSTAILERVAANVTALEQDADLVRTALERLEQLHIVNATIVQGALSNGHRALAPYDVVVVNGAVQLAPSALLSQLGEGGRLVTVFSRGVQGQAVLYLKEDGQLGQRLAFDAFAPTLPGFQQPAGFVF